MAKASFEQVQHELQDLPLDAVSPIPCEMDWWDHTIVDAKLMACRDDEGKVKQVVSQPIT